jgi:coenzyme F420-reducing hydrogenase delta subunit
LRQGASGVVVTGCREGDCAWRLGQRFTEERLRGQREPHLRADLPRERLRVAWPSAREPHAAQDALAALRASHAAARLAQEMRPHD